MESACLIVIPVAVEAASRNRNVRPAAHGAVVSVPHRIFPNRGSSNGTPTLILLNS